MFFFLIYALTIPIQSGQRLYSMLHTVKAYFSSCECEAQQKHQLKLNAKLKKREKILSVRVVWIKLSSPHRKHVRLSTSHIKTERRVRVILLLQQTAFYTDCQQKQDESFLKML
ncbi:hypothetical protein XENOCAPTIV_028390 [Xenoophorus captivus]|uniref:Secreted protein n=1 Tax=Xenoophorus captivus TaxID=1517983 RepID=A0ABV0QNF0_9TELE